MAEIEISHAAGDGNAAIVMTADGAGPAGWLEELVAELADGNSHPQSGHTRHVAEIDIEAG